MKPYAWMFLLALAFLPSCTGSTTDEIAAVLAVAVAPPSSAPQIRFYDTSRLQPGSGASISGCQKTSAQDSVCQLVWSWTLDQPIVSVLYQRGLQGGAGDQLWVLTASDLRRYSATGFTTNPAAAPPLPANTLDTPGLGVNCSQGYLRLGSSTLLVVCPPTDPTSTALPTAWQVNLNTPTLNPSINPPLDLSALAAFTPLRLSLDNQDRLLYLSRQTIGIGTTRGSTDVFRDLTTLAGRPGATAVPSDFIFLTDTRSNTSTAYGLYDDPIGGDPNTYLLSWDLSSTPSFTPSPTPIPPSTEVPFSANTFATGGPPLVVFGSPVCTGTTCSATNGRGLARFDGGYKLPPANLLSRSLQYSSAVLGLDRYLYAAQANSSFLRVLDFFGPTESLTASGLNTLTLDPQANAPTVALAYIPVVQ
ncbi:MAG: hypothetical protein K6T57_01490 [Thermaceae bacterium]|nr:hypothetical protein [Thermaceae bacterium]